MEEMVPTLPGFGGCQLLVCCFIEEELDQNDSLELSIPDLGWRRTSDTLGWRPCLPHRPLTHFHTIMGTQM